MLVGSKRHPAVIVVVAYLAPLLPVPIMDHVDSTRPASFVRVSRVGGPKSNIVTDGPMFTFDCWHPKSAEPLACLVADLLENSPGTLVPYTDDDGVTNSAWLRWHEEVGGPTEFRDEDVPDSDRWKYTARLGIATNV